MKTIGRIILVIVGAIMLVVSVPVIIVTANQLSESGVWWDPTTLPQKWTLLVRIVGQGLNALAGLTALWGAIRGKKSFRLALFAIILLIPPIMSLIGDSNSGYDIDWTLWLLYGGSFALPIGYFIGFLLV